jgi:hypothetical protein
MDQLANSKMKLLYFKNKGKTSKKSVIFPGVFSLKKCICRTGHFLMGNYRVHFYIDNDVSSVGGVAYIYELPVIPNEHSN